MKKASKSMKSIVIFLVIAMLTSSCMYNKMRIIQDKNEIPGRTYEYKNTPPEYHLKKNDILYISIVSTNKDIGGYFQSGGGGSGGGGGMGSAYYLNGFTVNDTGYVMVPVLGGIYVEDKTVKEIEDIVQKKTDELLNKAIATVRLVSFNVTYLGEVGSQGKFTIMQDNLNILDGLALVGGITDYGNSKNVLLIRQTPTGSISFRIDLTDRKILSDKNFYLQPNDILVVEPLKFKSFKLGVQDYTIILTTITSVMSMIFLIANLTK